MYIEISPGSRLKTCDVCGTQMLEAYPNNYIPAMGLTGYTSEDRDKMCPTCRDNYNTYGRRVIRRSAWAKYGIEPK